MLCAVLAIATGLPLPAYGGDLFTRAKAHWDYHKGVPTAESLAAEIQRLEKHIDCVGTIVAKQPDVWGQARMMKHRQDFEKQISLQLGQFRATLQGSLSRTDQAYLASAFSLSAAISGAPAVQLPQSASASQEIVSRQRALLNAQGVANPTTAQLQAAGTPTTIPPPTTNDSKDLIDNVDSVIKRRDTASLATGVKFDTTELISLEPTEFLDQMARFLNHLNELRRINEGDDTADSPGYGLHLVRIPVSILPGSMTRKGYGAEITVTATPYLGRDLLPTTFRNLVINDVVSQSSTALTEFFNSPTSLGGFSKIRDGLLKAAEQGAAESAQSGPTYGTTSELGRHAAAPPLVARTGTTLAGRDTAVRRTAQEPGTTLKPLTSPVQSRPNPYQSAYDRILVEKFGTPGRAMAPAAPPGGHAPPAAAPLPPPNPEQIRQAERNIRQVIEKEVARVPSRSVPATRSRNARYAFPGTQMGEVYGGELILPVALQTYDVVLRKRLEDDPSLPFVVQHQRVAGLVQDQVVAAYDFLARPESGPLWANFATPALAAAVRTRDAATIKATRDAFLASLPNYGLDPDDTYGRNLHTTTAAFAWALVVESVLLNERLIQDIHETATAKGMPAPAADGMPFFLPCPPDEARNAFNDYVRLRFPIHVFALDPVNQEQNIADQLARTRELQLALSLAFASGNISASNMTRFARRLELQAETIALNRTQVAFSHGEEVFGWRFQPRFQAPPTQNNLAAFAQTLVGGPTRDGDRRQLEIEPGMRECVALVIMPSFVPYVTFETRANWYRLNSPKHAEIDTLKFLELSRSIQRARTLAQAVCDGGQYRNGDVALLLNRVNQLSAKLPMQMMISQVPYENTHGGFELFNVGVTDLGPELRSWYGAPGVSVNNGTSLFLVGDSFSVHQTSVVVGNKLIGGDDLSLLSRQVMRVNVPPGTQAVTRGGRSFVEASIATPYGVSQPLYIPVVDATPPAAAPALVSAFSITSDTRTLKIAYEFRRVVGRPQTTVGGGRPAPGDQKIDIVWSSPTGIAPLQVQVDFNFDYKGAPIRISQTQPIRPTGGGGLYRIEGAALDQIAREYVLLLDELDDFSIDKPLPSLETTGITVKPLSGGTVLDAKAMAMTNGLKVMPTPTPMLPQPAAGAGQLGSGAPLAPDEVPPPPSPSAPERGLRSPPLPAPSAPGAQISPARRQGAVALTPLTPAAPLHRPSVRPQ